jgi:hypothetical protein
VNDTRAKDRALNGNDCAREGLNVRARLSVKLSELNAVDCTECRVIAPSLE